MAPIENLESIIVKCNIFGTTIEKIHMYNYIEEWKYAEDCDIVLVTLPKGIARIESRAFAWCNNLTTIIIPDSVAYISDNAFTQCSNLTIYSSMNSYAHQYAAENNINFVIMDNDKFPIVSNEKLEKWEIIFRIIERFDIFGYTEEIRYKSIKAKLLSGFINIIKADEFEIFKKSIVEAEGFANKGQQYTEAYILRRALYHSREEGIEEIAILKDKFGGCYIATAIYGSYDDPAVHLLRTFRDNYLEKTYWGQKFVKLYYKYSPSIAKKLKGKRRINIIIKLLLDNLVVKNIARQIRK